MRQLLQIAIFALVCAILTSCVSESNTVVIKTNKGDITVELFDETPRHKKNFQKLVNATRQFADNELDNARKWKNGTRICNRCR